MPRRPDAEPDRAEARSFEADDARLNAELDRYERTRSRFGPEEYGHDENYRPGYHLGGTRFGFFGGPHDADHGPRPQPTDYGPGPQPAEYGQRAMDDRDFDPDYLAWRQRQFAKHDRDYGDWRREQMCRYDDDYWRFRTERREDFHQRFQDWRDQRETDRGAAPAANSEKPR
jgi:hypothetical protein